jgi:hypothetical protein
MPSAQPEAPSAPEGEALRVEEERNGVPPNQNWQIPYLQYLHRGELPLDRAKARRLARRAKLFVLLGDRKELYHRSPQASSSDAYPSPKVKNYYKKYTRGLAVITQRLEPLLETPSDKVSTGQPRWPTPLGLYAPAKGVNSMQSRPTCPLRLCKQYPSPSRSLCGVWTSSVPCRRHPGVTRTCWSPSTILQVDRSQTPKQHQVRTGGGVLHQHHPSLWGPELHHHRQRHPVHRQKVPGLLRGSPHPGGLGRRSSPHDEWASRVCQRHDSARTQSTDLQRPQQIR